MGKEAARRPLAAAQRRANKFDEMEKSDSRFCYVKYRTSLPEKGPTVTRRVFLLVNGRIVSPDVATSFPGQSDLGRFRRYGTAIPD